METKLNIIDVNRFNPSVDWEKVKEQADGVIIRGGYRGITGEVTTDPSFPKHIKGAIAAGIPRIGVYWWSAYTDAAEADVDASYLMTVVAQYKDKINFGVWLQSKEFPSACPFNELDADSRTEAALAFLEKIKVQGLQSGVYAEDDWFAEQLNVSELADYPLWVACAGDTPPEAVKEYAGWRYANSAKVEGVTRGAGQSWFTTDFAEKK